MSLPVPGQVTPSLAASLFERSGSAQGPLRPIAKRRRCFVRPEVQRNAERSATGL